MSHYNTIIQHQVADINGDIDVIDLHVKVQYNYYAGCRGARDSLGGVYGAGPALEPDSEAEIEIVSVIDDNGIEIELPNHEQRSLEEEIMNDLVNDFQEYEYEDRD